MTTLAIDIGGTKLAAALIGADDALIRSAIAENFLRLPARLRRRCVMPYPH